jgi:thiamine biosynthesis lipoprotein
LPDDDEIRRALALVGFQHVALDPDTKSISFLRQGIELNLNAIGKGYALDRAAELLMDNGVDNFLFHGGRSSVLANGCPPGSTCGGWCIGLRHPLRPAGRLAEFYLHDCSLATSGSGTQFFRHRGRRYGHILDPRTGLPAEGILSATVLAPTAAEADALSTAFYVMAPTQVAEFCQRRSDIAALLVCPAEREGAVALHGFGLNENNWSQIGPG